MPRQKNETATQTTPEVVEPQESDVTFDSMNLKMGNPFLNYSQAP